MWWIRKRTWYNQTSLLRFRPDSIARGFADASNHQPYLSLRLFDWCGYSLHSSRRSTARTACEYTGDMKYLSMKRWRLGNSTDGKSAVGRVSLMVVVTWKRTDDNVGLRGGESENPRRNWEGDRRWILRFFVNTHEVNVGGLSDSRLSKNRCYFERQLL